MKECSCIRYNDSCILSATVQLSLLSWKQHPSRWNEIQTKPRQATAVSGDCERSSKMTLPDVRIRSRRSTSQFLQFPVDKMHPLMSISSRRSSEVERTPRKYQRERMILFSFCRFNALLALAQIHSSDWLRRRTLSVVTYLVLLKNKPTQFPVLHDNKTNAK